MKQLDEAWQKFTSHFQNSGIQENIRAAKEEEYQEGFVRDLFVHVLGYTLKPQLKYNFVLEKKTETDASKSDGAILRADNILAVIELKDTGTTTLDKIEKQAFGYKNKHKNCTYVITSNFEKLRFYINDATEYEEFDLFLMPRSRFDVLYACLQVAHIERDVPLKLNLDSAKEEEDITRKLYSDYSSFKKTLFASIKELNPGFNQLDLFRKTQKLLDRLLFIFFAEDRLLIPPNIIRTILDDWQKLKELDSYVPLYDRFKKHFGYLNNGYESAQFDIFAYNGGLFAPDEILDNVIINDTVLYEGSKKLAHYDFESEVDVNILGHIFEHSLNEIEEVQASFEGSSVDKTKTRRKKDGVFYTPRYITKYIVDNTLGELCRQQRNLLKITDEEFAYRKRKNARENLLNRLDGYREWLLQITICDPACGSGAFLNQALEFLIAEHKYVDELKSKLFGDAFVLTDHENEILENNLFGVDINEEATEIARLSLWLRTAKKGRKLSNLSNNIKCGNSIVENEGQGSKTLNWKTDYSSIFAKKGGFDVVIGNPPYVDIKGLPAEITDYIFGHYATSNNRVNLFSVFIEKGIDILKSEGYFSFIIPSALLTQESYKKIRELILNNTTIHSIVRLPNESFGGAAGEVKVDTIILTFQHIHSNSASVKTYIYKGFDRINEISENNADELVILNTQNWQNDNDKIFRINANNFTYNLIAKIEKDTAPLIDCADFSLGVTPYDKYKGHRPEQIENRVFHSTVKKDDTFKMLLAGNDVRRYSVEWGGEEWISYGRWLGAARELRFFTDKRIIVKQIIDWTDKRIWAALTDKEFYNTQNAFNLLPREGYTAEYLLALLNSRLFSFYLRKKFLEEYKDRFQKILIKDCKEIPVKKLTLHDQAVFVENVTAITEKIEAINKTKKEFEHLLLTKFNGLKINKKLADWNSQSAGDFLKELKKQKIPLSVSEEADWIKYFESQKDICNNMQLAIDELDTNIDKLIYNIYDVSKEEINIVEEK